MVSTSPIPLPKKKGTGGNLLPLAGAVFVIIAGAFVLYWPVLSNNNPLAVPWGSDTLGHISRMEFLASSLEKGNWLPYFYPSWYLGMQLFRYYPPLSYYLLILINQLTHQLVLTVNIFIFLCALIGGISFLLYKKWIGWLPAIGGGLVYLILPDNVRVAFSEGNLPRVLASGFIPLLFYFLLNFAEKRHRINLVGICALFILFVFCHPMMAAIYAVFASLCVLFLSLIGVSHWRSAFWMIASMALGIGVSGWWLLPSLTGGITELNSSAVTQGLTVSHLSILLNPLLRLRNPEADYVGLSLVIISILSLVGGWKKDRRVVVFTTVGLLGILAYTPILNQLFNALPGHTLLWPYRFQGICSFLILLSCLWGISSVLKAKFSLPTYFLLAILVLDASLSERLVGIRDPGQAIVSAVTKMEAETGWRELTLDKSTLGSQVVYFIDTITAREQVFGWAYQGAKTASNVASLNDAVDFGTFAYLRDRLSMFGVDDVLVSNAVIPGDTVNTALSEDGFRIIYQDDTITYLHRDGLPRAILANWTGLAIGTSAANYSFLFPQVVQGNSPYLDDYSMEELGHYQTLVLAGFSWRDQDTAEALVEAATARGIRVVIDLTRTQQNPIAQIPEFLGVWGEPIILNTDPVTTIWEGQPVELSGFGLPGELWYTLTPQGVDQSEATFEYLGRTATVMGSLQRGENKIFFLGLNLVYHALETRDQNALSMLSSVLNIQDEEVTRYQTINLDSYMSGPNGYSFTVSLDQPADLLIPIACFDGTHVMVNGNPIPVRSIENLILISMPAGESQVQIMFLQTTIYKAGIGITVISSIIFATVLVIWMLHPLKRNEI